MSQSDSSRTSIAIVRETIAGTTPTTPEFHATRIKAPLTLNRTLTGVNSEELNGDRNMSAGVIVDQTVEGGFDYEFSHRSQYQLLPGLMCNEWNKVNERSGLDEVTSCDTTTFTVASGTAFAENDIVRSTGFTNSSNNKVFTALAASSATAIVTTGLTAETPTDSRVLLKKVGVHGATSDIVAVESSNRLTSTILDFTGLGLLAGQWIKLNGFATVANNGYCRVASVTAHEMVLGAVPDSWAADTGSGVNIDIYISDFIYNGVEEISYTAEVTYGAHDPVNYCNYCGLMVNSMSFSFSPEEVLAGSISFLGMSATSLSESRTTGATTIPASTSTVYNSSTNIGNIRFDGEAVAGPSWPVGLSVDVSNNLSETKVLGQKESADVNLGSFALSGTLETLFADATIYNKVLDGDSVSVDFALTDSDDHAVVFDIPAIKFLSAAIELSGNDSPMQVNPEISAYGDDTLGYTFSISQFQYVA